ncbi:zinc ribbon domain-containing protein [Halomicrobium urmianum]|uniref:zinc ribbon domain-containing protein n=1 Tax=Halomicrobium urmianum TaxID=1586233 RepID=UPI001CD91BB3|nr:zinc ribbon domain-containing protein [Halomicrobium urmianum]
MSRTDRKRPWLAAILAVASPGLGHVYLREWLRAALWFGLVLGSTLMLVPESVLTVDTVSLEAIMAASRDISMRNQLAMTAVVLLSGADAYWMATQGNRRAAAAEGARCPHCGKELDEDLAFCHWCTTRLAPPAESNAATRDPVAAEDGSDA